MALRGAITMHLFLLNILKPFNTSLCTENKLAYNLDMYNAFLIQIWLDLPLTVGYTSIDPISTVSTTLSSPKYTLCIAIISYMSNASLYKVMYLENPQIHDPLTHVLGMYLTMHYKCIVNVIVVFWICRIFILFYFNNKNVQCGHICYNINTTLCFGTEMNCSLCFVATPWQHLQPRVPFLCTSTSRASNALSRSPS